MKRASILTLFLTLVSLTLAGPALAQEPEADLNFADYELELVDYTLPNGLRVILAEDHSAPVVAVDIWYHVGGANDPEGRSGFAHMFEHMMFEGSENVGNDQYDFYLEAVGASNNAYTANDKTAYWVVAPANELPRVLWLESDRMASLAVTQEAFETQREVVIEEFNERVANQAYGESNRRLFTLPMQGYLPYEQAVIGSPEDLLAADLSELQAFHDTYYKPNNATLTIVGDIEVEQTQILVQAYFAEIPAGEPLTPIIAQYPLPEEFPVLHLDEETGCAIGWEETLIDAQVELPRYTTTVVGPERGTPDFYALSVLSQIMSGGDSSRLEQNIVRQGKAASAFMGLNDYLGASILYSGAFPNGGDSPEVAEELLRAEFDKVMTEGVTATELERVKQQIKVGSIVSFRQSALDTAEWLQDAVLTFGDPTAIAAELEQYAAVTAEEVQRVAQEYLCDRPTNILITLPEGEEALTDYPGPLVEPVEVEPVDEPASPVEELELTDEVLAELPEGVISRTEVPASLPVIESKFPPFETFTLENGLEMIFVEQTEVPQITMELFVGGANAAAPADKQEVADFMAELLTKGTRIRSAAQIAERIESVGGSVGWDVALEWTSLWVQAPRSQTRLAFNMLEDMARHPTFPQNEFEVVKEQALTFIEQDEVSPDTLADRQFGRIAYGEHPYGYYTNQETIENLSRADVVEFYDTFWQPNNALLVIVGDLTAEEAKTQTERVFEGWAADEVPDYLDYPEAELGDTSVIYVVDRPDSEQATIQIGNQGINALNPDRYALEVVNTVLGGGTTSRLYQNLRENKGYTYGVFSRFGQPSDTSTFRVLTDVDQNSAAAAIQEILKELETIRTEAISEQELAEAKGLIIGGFALSIEEPANFANRLASRQLQGIPLEELNTYLQTIEEVSAEEALAAAAKYIDTEQPIIVVVGDAEILQPQLAELAEVVVVDKDGQVIEE